MTQQTLWQRILLLASCAKVGLEALIDEATGYQYDWAEDALQVKLRAYLEDDGVASTCQSMPELRRRMAEIHG